MCTRLMCTWWSPQLCYFIEYKWKSPNSRGTDKEGLLVKWKLELDLLRHGIKVGQPSCLHIQRGHPSPPSEEIKKPAQRRENANLRVREDGVENLTLPLTAFPPVSEPAHGCKTILHTTWSH